MIDTLTEEELLDIRAAMIFYMHRNISITNPRYQEYEAILKKLNKTLQEK